MFPDAINFEIASSLKIGSQNVFIVSVEFPAGKTCTWPQMTKARMDVFIDIKQIFPFPILLLTPHQNISRGAFLFTYFNLVFFESLTIKNMHRLNLKRPK